MQFLLHEYKNFSLTSLTIKSVLLITPQQGVGMGVRAYRNLNTFLNLPDSYKEFIIFDKFGLLFNFLSLHPFLFFNTFPGFFLFVFTLFSRQVYSLYLIKPIAKVNDSSVNYPSVSFLCLTIALW